MSGVFNKMKNKKSEKNSSFKNLYRSKSNLVIAGVAGGLGEYFGVDPIIFRIIFLALAIYGGSGLLVYFVLWILIPKDQKGGVDDNIWEIKENANKFASRIKNYDHRKKNELFGIVFVVAGMVFLLNNFSIPVFEYIFKLWPVVFILVGFSILNKK